MRVSLAEVRPQTPAGSTVGANVDSDAWADAHALPRLSASLSASGRALAGVFVRHYVGSADRVVRPEIVAAAAAISEGLLFKHFPSKAALYAEILAEECQADPDLAHLLGQEPSTTTLVELVKGMVRHFLGIAEGPDVQEAQRLRLMATSHLNDGELTRML